MNKKTKIPTIINALQKKWEQYLDLRFGQLIYAIYAEGSPYDPFFFEDDKMLKMINQFPKNVNLKEIDLDRN